MDRTLASSARRIALAQNTSRIARSRNPNTIEMSGKAMTVSASTPVRVASGSRRFARGNSNKTAGSAARIPRRVAHPKKTFTGISRWAWVRNESGAPSVLVDAPSRWTRAQPAGATLRLIKRTGTALASMLRTCRSVPATGVASMPSPSPSTWPIEPSAWTFPVRRSTR